MEQWVEKRLYVTCPICNKKIHMIGKQRHAEVCHWTASNDFLIAWKVSDDYLKLSYEERYYKYRSIRNEYRFLVDDDGEVLQKFYQKKSDAKDRKIDFVLTFEDYCKLIYDAGIKSSDIGWKTDSHYVLGRYHDIGPYAVGNCRFITQSKNMYEAGINIRARLGIYTKNDGSPYKPPHSKIYIRKKSKSDDDIKCADNKIKSTAYSKKKINKSIAHCKYCGALISSRNKLAVCRRCYNLYGFNCVVKNKPSREELKKLIRNESFLKIGKRYNVSDNAVRKWCKTYNLPYKSFVIKSISNDEWDKI